MGQPHSINVLLIEDDPGDAFLIAEMLYATGDAFVLASAERLSAAVDRISGGGLDIILLDMNLPDSSGLVTVTRVLDKAGDLPIIVLTGLSDDAVGMEAVKQGAQDYLVKGEIDARSLKRSISYAIERKKTEMAFKASQNRLYTITAVLGEGLIVLDREGKLMLMNPAAEKLLGWSESDLLGKEALELICPGSIDSDTDCMASKTLSSGLCWRIHEDVFLKHDGSSLPVSHISTPLLENNEITGAVIAFHDITERKQYIEALKEANEELERRATTDTLTGAYNRLKINELLATELKRSQRYDTPLSLIMLDIDHFKRVNDLHGHNAGDQVLRGMSGAVAGNIREQDYFARWGGEEFMVLVPNNDLEHALVLAEKLRALVEAAVFSDNLRVTASFGVVQLHGDETVEAFTNRADEALYQAKRKGRNRVEVA